MSSKTKIVVLHMKELIYTAVFVILGILLILLLLFMFLPKDKAAKETAVESSAYVAGVYSSTITLNDQAVDVEVVVDSNNINSIELVNLDETVATMFPLMQPALDEISKQIYETQSTENITFSSGNKYTSTVLLDAINSALDKAKVKETE